MIARVAACAADADFMRLDCAVFSPTLVERGRTHSMLTAKLWHWRASLGLYQDVDDFIFDRA